MIAPINPFLIDTGTPPIPQALAWLSKYDAQKGPAIKLSQAAPGQMPPISLRMALASAAGSDEANRYGDIFGDLPFREAFADVTNTLYDGALRSDDIAITPGCNQAFMSVLMSVARTGDNIILPVPYYFNHAMAAQMLGIHVQPLICDGALGFVPEVAAAAEMIDTRTRAIVLVTPNNPTGAVYSSETIAAFAALAQTHGLWLILDETYRDFLPDDAGAPHALFRSTGKRDALIGLYSFSKAYAIPGHRLGAIIAPPRLMPELAKVLDTLQISPVRTAQIALAEEMVEMTSWLAANRQLMNQRARAFRAAMAPLSQFRIERIGAYFAYVRHGFTGQTAEAVARHLATAHGVLALPGSWFGPGQEQHLRFAFANADAETLGIAVERMSQMQITR
jgi:aspartate/methionine/tyrosine aminotransferase